MFLSQYNHVLTYATSIWMYMFFFFRNWLPIPISYLLTIKCVFVGYSRTQKGYKYYNPTSKNILPPLISTNQLFLCFLYPCVSDESRASIGASYRSWESVFNETTLSILSPSEGASSKHTNSYSTISNYGSSTSVTFIFSCFWSSRFSPEG